MYAQLDVRQLELGKGPQWSCTWTEHSLPMPDGNG